MENQTDRDARDQPRRHVLPTYVNHRRLGWLHQRSQFNRRLAIGRIRRDCHAD